MIIIFHQNAKSVARVMKDGTELQMPSRDCSSALWEIAEEYPEELIGWCEENLEKYFAYDRLEEIFHHDLIMASYSVRTNFLPTTLGYVDQLPFANINPEVVYGTWRMSSDMGGIKGKVLLFFRDLMGHIKNFEFLLNSIAKVGQQNSLFCYSQPLLSKSAFTSSAIQYNATTKQLFQFVFEHYSTVWTSVLLLCFLFFERKFPILAYLESFTFRKFFQKEIDLSAIHVSSSRNFSGLFEIDVIIPTIGRASYLKDVIEDFSRQTLLPSKIIIVEQDAENAETHLHFIKKKEWPFEIIHHFTEQVGACNARNMALAETAAEWVFFSDDDQRFDKDLIHKISLTIKKYGLDCLTTSYLQVDERKFFKLPKQWGTFGAGNSVVRGKYARSVRFSPAFEHGYGEDADFGRQLKNLGCDVIYIPDLEICHLKAPVGGFRKKHVYSWEKEKMAPKPSPTVMAHALKHYTAEQILGFKVSLFIRYYKNQPDKNPFVYLRQMNQRWKSSREVAEALLKKEKDFKNEIIQDKR